MVEVFKTNVDNQWQAYQVLELIRRAFPDYRANFDLSDRDRILRIECFDGAVDSSEITRLLIRMGHFSQVLEGDIETSCKNLQFHSEAE